MRVWCLVPIFLSILIQFFAADSWANEVIPLKLVVNTVVKGELFALLEGSRQIYIAEEDYTLIGMEISLHPSKIQNIDGRNYVLISGISGINKVDFDENSLSLNIDVDPVFLDKTRLDLTQEAIVRADKFGIDSAFLKYAWIQRGISTSHDKIVEMPIEGVISAHDVLLQSTLTYRQDMHAKYWSRGISNLTRDFPASLSRLVLGDFAARSGDLGGSGVFAGISYSKNYSMATHFTKYPSLNISGLLNTPSRVNMYINNTIVRSEKLPAGEYEIENLPNLFGAGDLEVEIIDAFGRTQRRIIPYYISTRLLREGLHDYSYNLGFKRDSLIVAQPKYEAYPSFLGFHRYGVTDRFTAGYRFEFTNPLKNGGLTFNYLFGTAGELEFGAAYSDSQTQSGYAAYFRYGFTSNYFHGRYTIRQNSDSYQTLSNLDNLLAIESNQSITVGTHGLSIGSLSFNYAATKSFTSADIESYSIVYGRRLAGQVAVLLRAVRTVDGQLGKNDSFYLSVNASLGRRSAAIASYAQDKNTATSSLNLQRFLPLGSGFGYRIKQDYVQTKGFDSINVSDISLFGRSRYLSAAADYFIQDSVESYQLQASGSLSYIDDSFFLSRPIQDSFGLVKIGNLDDVRVYYSSELMGETKNGRLLLPNLVSYADNQIAIEPADVPVDQNIKKTSVYLVPKYRSGSIAQFEIEKFQGFAGRIFVRVVNEKRSADFAGLTLRGHGRQLDSVVGRNGEFYFENLESGEYQVTVQLNKVSCTFTLEIPESNEMMVELGEYECQI